MYREEHEGYPWYFFGFFVVQNDLSADLWAAVAMCLVFKWKSEG